MKDSIWAPARRGGKWLLLTLHIKHIEPSISKRPTVQRKGFAEDNSETYGSWEREFLPILATSKLSESPKQGKGKQQSKKLRLQICRWGILQSEKGAGQERKKMAIPEKTQYEGQEPWDMILLVDWDLIRRKQNAPPLLQLAATPLDSNTIKNELQQKEPPDTNYLWV